MAIEENSKKVVIDYLFINSDFFLEADIDFTALNLKSTKIIVPKMVIKDLINIDTEKSKKILTDFEQYKKLSYFIFDDSNLECNDILEYVKQYNCYTHSKYIATFILKLIGNPDFNNFNDCNEFANNVFVINNIASKYISFINNSAQNGDATAQQELGFCYEKGFGVEINYESAISWYKKSAEQNDAIAFCNLGGCLSYPDLG